MYGMCGGTIGDDTMSGGVQFCDGKVGGGICSRSIGVYDDHSAAAGVTIMGWGAGVEIPNSWARESRNWSGDIGVSGDALSSIRMSSICFRGGLVFDGAR